MHGQAGLASALSAWRARASGAGLEAAATTAKRYNFVNTCNYLLSWRCACSGKVRSSGRVMQQHSCSRSQRASSTSFWSSCSARRATPPAPARPSSPAQLRSQSRAGSTRARAAAVTRGTSAARNDGSTSVHGELDVAHQRLSSPPGWAPLRSRAGRGGQRVPSGRTAPRWGRGAGTAPPRAPRTPQANARQAIARPRRAPYLNSAVYLKS